MCVKETQEEALGRLSLGGPWGGGPGSSQRADAAVGRTPQARRLCVLPVSRPAGRHALFSPAFADDEGRPRGCLVPRARVGGGQSLRIYTAACAGAEAGPSFLVAQSSFCRCFSKTEASVQSLVWGGGGWSSEDSECCERGQLEGPCSQHHGLCCEE